MRKTHTDESRSPDHRKTHQKTHQEGHKGRVLARELAQELRYVPGGGGIGTFTAPPDPDWPPDRD